MTKDNPFPGMNPFLERHWSDVHTKLITYIADALAEQLPLELKARSEERVTLHDAEGKQSSLRADVAVVESWKSGVRPKWEPEATKNDGIVATEPQIVLLSEETERWIEITDTNGELITVIEVLSPANKGRERADYIARRDTYVHARVNLVEIDLLRGGTHSLVVPADGFEKPAGAYYLTSVFRAPTSFRLEVYVTSMREPLPNISIPLRPADKDVVLALQPLVNRCHRMGAYWNADYQHVPGPVLPEDELAWVNEQVKAAGLTD
jgi:hypothetical protein